MIYSSIIFGDSGMITEDEESKFDDRYIDYLQSDSPKWQEIEDLLDFAEKLKTKCDDLSDRMYILNTLIMCSSVTLVALATVSSMIPWLFIYYYFAFFLLLVIYYMFKNKIETRRRSESRALNSAIGFLRENQLLLTRDFSELQKIHLKIKLSRFDI